MFERFTDEARRTLFLGGQVAISRGRTEINPDDLVVGAIRDLTHPSSELFGQLGLTTADVETFTGYGPLEPTAVVPNGNDFTFTRAGSQALQFAASEADALGHAPIGWEHLLLGILREGSCMSAKLLDRAGALDRLRALVRASSYERKRQQSASAAVGTIRTWTTSVEPSPPRSWWSALVAHVFRFFVADGTPKRH